MEQRKEKNQKRKNHIYLHFLQFILIELNMEKI
jgi:hypothetical protein